MLILSRKLGERIVIDENIELTVCAIRGDRVQLGLCAPQDVEFRRAEIHELIRSNQEATKKIIPPQENPEE
jgi:carbon storage regulator